MRLSMWVLADWLSAMRPEVKVSRGRRELRNARLLSESAEYSRSTVYLEQVDAGTIVCSNGNDMLVVHSGDADEVLNAMLDAFEHYNEWSDRADDAIRERCALPELLEGARRQLRMSLVVADATYLIQAYADDGDLSAGVQREMLEAGSMPLSTILRINQDPSVRTAGKGVYYVDIPEMDSRCPVANLFVHDIHEGWLIGIRRDSAFTQGELDLLGAVAEKVEFWLVMNQRHEDRLDRNAMFEELLDGSVADADEVWRKLGVFRWRRDDAKRVYALRLVDASKNPQHVVDRFVEQLSSTTFLVHHEGQSLLLVDQSLIDFVAYEQDLARVLDTCGCVAGRSPAFADVMQLPGYIKAAQIAAQAAGGSGVDAGVAGGTDATIVDFERVKLPYALSLIRDNQVVDVRHGALATLADYDAEHGTQLGETLRALVANRGSQADTYRELFIHRTTLTYRLERIVELTGIDLEDPQTWLHLALSYALS